MSADFSKTAADLAAAKASIATYVAEISPAAAAVAALSADAVGQETDAARRSRLDTLLNHELGVLEAVASKLQGKIGEARKILAHDLFEVKGQL